MKLLQTTAITITMAMLSACTAASDAETAGAAMESTATVDLRLRDSSDSPYRAVDSVTVPSDHEIGDGIYPYEGIGWENGTVGYRLYLDRRLVSDIFGKQVSAPVLPGIVNYGGYHELAAWGMDVLKVGPSLGLGGLGVMRSGKPTQFGNVPELSAKINSTGGSEGRFTLTASGIEGENGAGGGFVAKYLISTGSPMTLVNVDAAGDLPLASGIVMHDGAEFFRSGNDGNGGWRYIATWGDKQSENGDGLGMALFYRKSEASYGGLANQTHYVAFNRNAFTYGFLAAWERDPLQITSKEEFAALLDAELERLQRNGQ